jgi:hypothetical protein
VFSGQKWVFCIKKNENIGTVLSGNKKYFWSPKIVFGEKPIFGLTERGGRRRTDSQ